MIPRIGPQMLDTIWGGSGRCNIWCLAYLQFRIEYPHLTEKQIHEYLGQTPESATLFIKKYQTYIRSQLGAIQFYKKQANELRKQNGWYL